MRSGRNAECPALSCVQPRSNLLRVAGKVKRGIVKLQRWVRANERLLIVAASSCIMSVSHTALRPVLPVFAKARCCGPNPPFGCHAPQMRYESWSAFSHTVYHRLDHSRRGSSSSTHVTCIPPGSQ